MVHKFCKADAVPQKRALALELPANVLYVLSCSSLQSSAWLCTPGLLHGNSQVLTLEHKAYPDYCCQDVLLTGQSQTSCPMISWHLVIGWHLTFSRQQQIISSQVIWCGRLFWLIPVL